MAAQLSWPRRRGLLSAMACASVTAILVLQMASVWRTLGPTMPSGGLASVGASGAWRSSASDSPSSRCTPVRPVVAVPTLTSIPGLADALTAVSLVSGRCEVLLSFGTSSYLPTLRNFLVTMRRVRHLHDVVVVGLSPDICDALRDRRSGVGSVHCVTYPAAKAAGDFGSLAFAEVGVRLARVSAGALPPRERLSWVPPHLAHVSCGARPACKREDRGGNWHGVGWVCYPPDRR
jgi:hypothetical protein